MSIPLAMSSTSLSINPEKYAIQITTRQNALIAALSRIIPSTNDATRWSDALNFLDQQVDSSRVTIGPIENLRESMRRVTPATIIVP
jgi:hypothetical protein